MCGCTSAVRTLQKLSWKNTTRKTPTLCVHRHQSRLLTISVIWLPSQIWLPQHILFTACIKEQLDRFLTSGMSRFSALVNSVLSFCPKYQRTKPLLFILLNYLQYLFRWLLWIMRNNRESLGWWWYCCNTSAKSPGVLNEYWHWCVSLLQYEIV